MKVIFTSSDAIVEQSAGKPVTISPLVSCGGSVMTRLRVLIPLTKEWKTAVRRTVGRAHFCCSGKMN